MHAVQLGIEQSLHSRVVEERSAVDTEPVHYVTFEADVCTGAPLLLDGEQAGNTVGTRGRESEVTPCTKKNVMVMVGRQCIMAAMIFHTSARIKNKLRSQTNYHTAVI